MLTFVEENLDACLRAINELYATYLPFRQEFENQNVKMLFPHCPGTHSMWCRDPVTSLDDIKGKKVRCTSYDAKVIEWFDGGAVGLGYGDCYVAMERGVIDVWWDAPLGTGWATKNYEVGPHIADLGSGMWAAITPVINLDTWNELPADLKKVIDDSSAQAYQDSLDIMDDYERNAVDEMIAGELAELHVWTDEEKAKASAIVQPALTDLWLLEAATKTGADAKAFISKYRALIEKHAKVSVWVNPYEYWLEQIK